MRRGEMTAVRVCGRLRVAGTIALLNSCVAGLGIGLLPEWLVTRELAARKLKRVLADWLTPETMVWALYRAAARATARIKLFIDAMLEGSPC